MAGTDYVLRVIRKRVSTDGTRCCSWFVLEAAVCGECRTREDGEGSPLVAGFAGGPGASSA
ncbi:hypothetical protein FACS1894200_13870 [Spirochaetia bacterium]|nr:hypothetical protein FACS1894200_13870 [Spirochaetia bacterium]